MTVAELIASLQTFPQDMTLDGLFTFTQRRDPPRYDTVDLAVSLHLSGATIRACAPYVDEVKNDRG